MNLRSIGTHNGSFHADEVTACALLLIYDLIDRDKIIRTRDQEILDECEYVCDVGGKYDPSKKRFDHHQIDYQGPLSSAGMILLYLKESKIIDEKFYDFLNRSLILGVDAHDNGQIKLEIGVSSFSQIVSNFMTIEYDAIPEEQDKSFFEALDFVYGHLIRLKKRYDYIQECREEVKRSMLLNTTCLMFDRPIPWIENFFDLGGENHPALFVIMPSGTNWKLRAIPPSLKERMKIRCSHPKNWTGLHEKDLVKVTGIEGAVFCHKGGFISIWKTKEEAVKALGLILAKEKEQK